MVVKTAKNLLSPLHSRERSAAERISRSASSASASTSSVDIDELLQSMSLEDKIGQMSQIEINMLILPLEDGDGAQASPIRLNETAVDYFIGRKGVGSVLNTFPRPTTAREYRRIAAALQRVAAQYGRPPVIWGLDSVHGANYVHGAVLAPQPLNLAATFNTSAAEAAGRLASRDTRAAGIQWLFSPLLGISLEPRWSRVFETFGEDPLLVRNMATAMSRGIQEPQDDSPAQAIPSRAAACAKHFIGYSMPRTGHDRSPSWIPTRHLYQYFVPAWQNLTALTVMESYTDYDGVPNVANRQSLDYLLRQRLGFDGVVVTDYQEMLNLRDWHRLVDSDRDAVLTSLRQGSVDMSMIPWDYAGYADAMVNGVRDHALSLQRVDESVRRVLRLKQELHMFEETITEDDPNLQRVGTDEQNVMNMLHESIVLTENKDNLLPLAQTSDSSGTRRKVLVTGPTASSRIYQSGGWTGQWQGAPNEQDWFTYGATVLGALSQDTDWDVSYSCGTNISGGECEDDMTQQGLVEQVEEWAGIEPHGSIVRAVSEASDRDIVVVCVGEEPSTEKPGDIRSLRLPEGQYELVRQLRRNSSAKIVLVYFGGRTRLMEDMVENSDAVLVAFLPGPSAGQAVADILTGRANPSGRLPITYPKFEDGGGLPYFHEISDLCTKGDGILPHYEYTQCEVQWAFGHGLSYTTFEYSDLSVVGGIDEDLKVTVSVKNIGQRAGSEAVLFFTFDEFRSTTPEYKRLRTFTKVFLHPGESTTIILTVPLDDLKFIGPNDDRHFIIDPSMRSFVGVGPSTDCRANPDSDLCARIQSKNPDQAYVPACEAACDIWKMSGCGTAFQLSETFCRSKCTKISSYPSSSMDLANDGWGWKYVDCIEAVSGNLQNTEECWLMTSMCRDVFDQRSSLLNEFGMGNKNSSSLMSTSNTTLIALLVGVIASLAIIYVVKGGEMQYRSRRCVAPGNVDNEDSIQLTPSLEV